MNPESETTSHDRFRMAAVFGFLAFVLAVQVWTMASTIGFVGKPFAGFRFEPTLTVSALNLASWPGAQAGLAQRERIKAVRDTQVRSAADLWRHVRSVPAGTHIRYQIAGHGQETRDVSVPTATFTARDWLNGVFPTLAVGFGFWLIGTLGFVLRRTNPAAQVHALFTGAFAANLALMTDYDFAAGFGAVNVLATLLLAGITVHLGLVFPQRSRWVARHPAWLLALYAPGVLLGALGAVLFEPVGAAFNPGFDAYFFLYGDFASTCLALGILVQLALFLRNSLRPESFLAGRQAKISLYGAAVGFLPGAVLWIVPTVIKTDPITTMLVLNGTILLSLFFPATVAYAIVRTKLFDIDLVIKRTIQYAVLVGLLGTIYFATMVVAGYTLQKVLPSGGSEATNALAAAIMAFTFSPLQSGTRKFLDRAFARGGYDPTQILIEFGQSARRATEPSALFDAFRTALERTFRPAYLAMSVPNLATFSQGAGAAVLSEPLRAGPESLGVASVGTKHSDLPYTQADRDLFGAICHQLALAVENNLLIHKIRNQERVTKELEIAHQVQAGLLPSELPGIPFTRLAAHNQAALEMGGDFYDIMPLDGGAYGIVLGDVSGKGVPAALLGAVCLTLFRAIAPQHASPIEALQAINEVLVRHRASRKMFVAITYVVYHPESGWVMGVNAGNPEPLHCGEPISSKGMPLGAAKTIKYCDFELILEPGETLVLLSDGMVDARNADGQRYGDDRFAALIAQHAESDPADLVRSVRAELSEFQGARSLYDDLTIVALRRIGSGAEPR